MFFDPVGCEIENLLSREGAMNGIRSSQPVVQTQAAAQACMSKIRAVTDMAQNGCSSPLYAMAEIIDRLLKDPATSRKISVVRASRNKFHDAVGTQATLASAWPLRLDALAGKDELPLIYLTSSETSTELCALSSETRQRGIFCNDIETLPSHWPKGAHPWLPLWLLSNPQCQPYDPASAAEARAITLHALQSLYVEGRAGFYYMALHDESNETVIPLTDAQANAAVRGMYRLADMSLLQGRPRIRLLGAGLSLRNVLEAAHLLCDHWNVDCEVWSCPSYTRLARDADSAKRWSRLHPEQLRRSWHLRDCLGEEPDLVVAITGYPQAVVEQLRAHVAGRFVALGADSPEPRLGSHASAHSIVVEALRALADDGQIDYGTLKRAMAEKELV